MRKKKPTYLFLDFKSSDGISLLSVLIAVGILGIIASMMSRLMTSSFRSVKHSQTISSYTQIKNLVSRRISCNETLAPLTAASCTTPTYINLRYVDSNGVTKTYIPAGGGRFNQQIVRARCTSFGFDIRAATFIAQTAIPTAKLDFSYGGASTSPTAINKQNFVQDLQGFYLNWNNKRAFLFGPVNASNNLLPCQDEVATLIGGTPPPGTATTPTTFDEIFGGIYQTRCNNMGCRRDNNKFPSAGCNCTTGYTPMEISEFCTGSQGSDGKWQGDYYCDNNAQGGYATQNQLWQNCGYVSFLCISNANIP